MINFQLIKDKIKPTRLVMLLSLSIFAGCGLFGSDDERKKVEYYGSSTRSGSLEIPPDLTQTDPEKNIRIPGLKSSSNTKTVASKQATAQDIPSQQAVSQDASSQDIYSDIVLSEPPNVTLKRDGDQHWLIVDEVPSKVWPQLINFWEKDGIELVTNNPQSGVIETDWLINYADLTSGAEKLFRGLINKLTSSGQRDKYRIRMERGEKPNTTEVYVTHQGLEEVAVGASTKEVPDYRWVKRPTDRGLEIEIMRMIMSDLGVDDAQINQIAQSSNVKRKERARLLVDNVKEPILILDGGFSRSWQRVGLALDRAGYTIVGRNREQGGYVIELADADENSEEEQGILGRLFNKNNDKPLVTYKSQIRLVPQEDGKTLVAVATESGLHDSSQTAVSLLKQLYGQLK